jgi:hypothetical protein
MVMRHLLHYILLAAILLLIVYAAIGSPNGALFHHPLAIVGVGLIGLGLCKRHREGQAVAVRCQRKVEG